MSSPCNFCAFRWMQQQAAFNDEIVEIRPRPDEWFPLGVDVYVRGANETPDYRSDVDNLQWRGWFAEISEQCVC